MIVNLLSGSAKDSCRAVNASATWAGRLRRLRRAGQVTMEEAEFRRRAPQLEVSLAAPGIGRVLEGRLPLAWEAALMVGCCAAPAPHAASRDLGDTFSLTDLAVGPPPCLPASHLHLERPLNPASQAAPSMWSLPSPDGTIATAPGVAASYFLHF